LVIGNCSEGTGNGQQGTGKTHVFKHEIEIMTLFFSCYASFKNILFLTEL